MGYNYLNLYPLQSLALVPLNQTITLNILSLAPSLSMIYPDCSPLWLCLLQGSLWGYSCCGIDLSTVTVAWRYICSSVALPTVTAHSGVNLLHYSLTHGSPSTGIPALMWDYPRLHTFRCSSMDLSTGTDVSVSTSCSTDFSLGSIPAEVSLLLH